MNHAAGNRPVRRGALWFGLLGGAVAWLVHLISAYVVAEFGCVGGWGTPSEGGWMGITRVAWIEVGLTLVTTLAAGAATVVAWQCHRRLRSPDPGGDSAEEAERSTAWAGVLTSGLFTFAILFESIPILYYLNHC